jgi:alkanesulfonate monooxygenase SsuD/methylene tetrahydromethanopterin reductase-like flavin-dependent oxidoreductase (luciferase family)
VYPYAPYISRVIPDASLAEWKKPRRQCFLVAARSRLPTAAQYRKKHPGNFVSPLPGSVQISTGERLDYDGTVYEGGGLSLRGVDPAPVPIDVAALGPKAVELAGRSADGWVPQLFTPAALGERMDDLRRGADLGDRDVKDLRVAVTVRACALDDGERAHEVARRQIAFMIAAYGPYYRESAARQGFESEADAIEAAWSEGDREAAVESVTDEMVDSLVAAGRPDAVRETVARFEEVDGVDAVRVGFFGEMTADERRRTMEVLA